MNKENYTIRKMKVEDVEEIFNLGTNRPEFSFASGSFWTKNQLRYWCESPNDLMLVAEENDEIIGFSLYAVHPPTGKVTWENLFVREDKRGKGIAEKFTKEGVRLLKTMGYSYAIMPSSPHKDFENIKKIDKNGIEYWEARELPPLLGYENWQKSEDVIKRAVRACMNSGQDADNHFNQTVKMVKIGSNTMRKVMDYKLDRYACYLIAQNGDPKKQEIAMAQTYFAIQTRRQEIFQQLPDTSKRLFIRNQVSDHNKKLFKTAKEASKKVSGTFLYLLEGKDNFSVRQAAALRRLAAGSFQISLFGFVYRIW